VRPCITVSMAVRIPLLVAASALLVVACESPVARPHATVTAASAQPRQVPCILQYANWRDSRVARATSELAGEVADVRGAVSARDAAALAEVMRQLMPTAVALSADPMPRCTDMHGIYAELVDRVYLAGQDAQSARSLAALDRAAAVLTGATAVEHELTAEIVKSIGASSCPQGRKPRPSWPPC
jgi:hypothetical protein